MNMGLFEILEQLDDYIREAGDEEEAYALLALGFVFGIGVRAGITSDNVRSFLGIELDDDRPEPAPGLVPLPLVAPIDRPGREFRARVRVHFRPHRMIMAGTPGALHGINVLSVRVENDDGAGVEYLHEPTPAERFTAAFGAPFFSGPPLKPDESLVVEVDADIPPGVSALVLGHTIEPGPVDG